MRVVRDQSGIELVQADRLRDTFVPHFHEEYSVGLVINGGLSLLHGGSRHTAAAGSLGIVNPGDVHAGGPATENGWSFINIFVPVDLFESVAEDALGRCVTPMFPRVIFDDVALSRAFMQLHHAMAGDGGRLCRESAALDVLSGLMLRHSTASIALPRPAPNREPLRRVCDFLRTCYAADCRLDSLSAMAGMSRFHFLRLFRSTIGMTPHAFQMQVRVTQAKRLMISGRSIAAVAAECGFCDQSHLHRYFKRFFGYTPGEYRTALGPPRA